MFGTRQEWRAAGAEQLRLSTIDLTGVPSLANLHRGVDFALKHREQGNSVYVHCKAGRSRSATLAAAYLIRVSPLPVSVVHRVCHRVCSDATHLCRQLHCWTPEEACRKLASVRPHILVRSGQLEVLRRYHLQVCGRSS